MSTSVLPTSPKANSRGGRLCPSSDDEAKSIFVLHGRNEVPNVEVWGWSNNIPLGFPGLKANLAMKTVIYNDNECTGCNGPNANCSLPEPLDELSEGGESLRRLLNSSSTSYLPIYGHFVVQVVAKSKSQVLFIKPKEGDTPGTGTVPATTLVIGNLIVADQSGACLLTLINESVQVIHDNVEVGDYLVIFKAVFRSKDISTSKYHLPYHDFILNVELKIDKYSVRHIQFIPARRQTNWKPKLDQCILIYLNCEENKLWTPEDVEVEIQARDSPGPNNPKDQPNPPKYFDILGILCYVGRVERYEVYRDFVECFEPLPVEPGDINSHLKGIKEAREVRQFCVYRWITIVDKSSRQIPVKLHITKDTMLKQKDVVPGAIILLTNCKLEEGLLSVNSYTMVYTGEDIELYFRLMPSKYFKSALNSVMSFKSYKSIVEREDISWTAGGTLHLKIEDENDFLEKYCDHLLNPENSDPFYKTNVPRDYIFARREMLTVAFRGRIVLVQEIQERNCLIHINPLPGRFMVPVLNKFVYGDHNEVSRQRQAAGDKNYSNPSPCMCKKCHRNSWFTFKRRLTQFIPENVTTTRDLIKLVTEERKPLLGPLQMPSEYEPISDELPQLAKCERAEDYHFYRIVIKAEDCAEWYDVVWNTFHIKEMRRKYKSAIDKVIIGFIDMFHAEEEFPDEVVLRDFVIYEDPLKNEGSWEIITVDQIDDVDEADCTLPLPVPPKPVANGTVEDPIVSSVFTSTSISKDNGANVPLPQPAPIGTPGSLQEVEVVTIYDADDEDDDIENTKRKRRRSKSKSRYEKANCSVCKVRKMTPKREEENTSINSNTVKRRSSGFFDQIRKFLTPTKK